MSDQVKTEGVEQNPNDHVLVEIWKKIVDVQQHFNDLALRIRNYTLIVVGAVLALSGYVIKEVITLRLPYLDFSVSAAGLIVWLAIIPVLAFYFMDRWWYHRLLKGAVNAGIAAESALQNRGYSVNLGTEITKASPFVWRMWGKKVDPERSWLSFPKRKMHSEAKMDFFYLALVVSLLAIGFLLLNVKSGSPMSLRKASTESSAGEFEAAKHRTATFPLQTLSFFRDLKRGRS
jgi:hypothetical protein